MFCISASHSNINLSSTLSIINVHSIVLRAQSMPLVLQSYWYFPMLLYIKQYSYNIQTFLPIISKYAMTTDD